MPSEHLAFSGWSMRSFLCTIKTKFLQLIIFSCSCANCPHTKRTRFYPVVGTSLQLLQLASSVGVLIRQKGTCSRAKLFVSQKGLWPVLWGSPQLLLSSNQCGARGLPPLALPRHKGAERSEENRRKVRASTAHGLLGFGVGRWRGAFCSDLRHLFLQSTNDVCFQLGLMTQLLGWELLGFVTVTATINESRKKIWTSDREGRCSCPCPVRACGSSSAVAAPPATWWIQPKYLSKAMWKQTADTIKTSCFDIF